MPKKYRSKKAYLAAKRKSEYYRYLRTFKKKRTALENRGVTPYDSVALTYTQYFAAKGAMLETKGASNIQRNIIQKQLYKFSYNSSVLLRQAAKKYDANFKDLSLADIRTGKEFDLSFLSDINNELKREFPKMTGKERASWIRREWFGYAS